MPNPALAINSAHLPQSLYAPDPLTEGQHAAQAVTSSSLLGSEHFDMDAMTPDSLIVYLNGRIGSVDDQMSDIFDRQKNSEKVRTELRAIQQDLTKVTPNNDEQKGLDLDSTVRDDILERIKNIEHTDPDLAADLRAHLISDGQILSNSDLRYDTFELNGTKDYLNLVSKDLESGSQMDMIQLQSLMGARQTAIQLSTNLISALNESQKSVVGNIR
jgi:hypothetical protein